MSLLVGGLDVVGDEDEGSEDSLVLGARRMRKLARMRMRGMVRVPTPRWMRSATSQGVSRPQEELDFLPFEPFTLTVPAEGTPIPAGAGGFLLARPQRPFRAERLVMSAILNDAEVAFGVVIDPAIFVGAVQVGATQGGVPITAFGPTAFGVRLSMPSAGQGTDVKIFVRTLITVPDASTLTVTAVMFGRAMR